MPGCSCAQCFGFAEYMLNLTGRDYGLPRATGRCNEPIINDQSGRRSGVLSRVACDGSMTCPCDGCSAERAARLRAPRRIRQPWELAA